MITDKAIVPDFLIIGAMKSGTSTLHRNLLHHPTIGMSMQKEPNFFNKNYERGVEWYSSLFENGYDCYGETSPNYAKIHQYPETPKNIHNLIPDAKIIYIVRDPINRLISHLHHDLYRDRLEQSEISKMSFKNSDYLLTSNYYWQIKGFLEYFPKENFKILSFEGLINDPTRILNYLCNYLDQPEYDFKKVLKAYNTTEKKYWIYNYDFIHQNLNKKLAKLYNSMFYFYSKKIKKPILTKRQLKEIKLYLEVDMKKFSETFNYSTEEWSSYNSINFDE